MNLRRDPASHNWYVEWRDHRGVVHRWAGHTSRSLTERLGRQLERLVACRESGAETPPDLARWVADLPQRRRSKLVHLGLGSALSAPLDEQREQYREWLLAQDYHPRHVADLNARLVRLFDALGVTDFSRIEPARVEGWLREQRAGGLSAASSNHYVKSVKSFGSWLVRSGRLPSNPMQYVRQLNEATAPARPRRALEDDELDRLLEAARSGPDHAGLDGETRYWAYRLAAELGLLAGETRSLRVCDFDLGRDPSVEIPAQYARKRRETYVLPIRRDTARGLRKLFRGKAPGVTPFPLPRATARMIAEDLEAANIDRKDAAGRSIDYYSLRHTAITRLARTSASFSTVQYLARHKSPTTTARYVHARLADARAAIEAVPSSPEAASRPQQRGQGRRSRPA